MATIVMYQAMDPPVDNTFITGRVGIDMNEDEAKAAVQQTGLAILSTLRNGLGSLNKVNGRSRSWHG